jgi:hypothetical protein
MLWLWLGGGKRRRRKKWEERKGDKGYGKVARAGDEGKRAMKDGRIGGRRKVIYC